MINSSKIPSFSLYADDSNAGASGPNLSQLIISVNQELDKVYNWITSNYLSANNTKLLHLLFSFESNPEAYQLRLGNYNIIFPECDTRNF